MSMILSLPARLREWPDFNSRFTRVWSPRCLEPKATRLRNKKPRLLPSGQAGFSRLMVRSGRSIALAGSALYPFATPARALLNDRPAAARASGRDSLPVAQAAVPITVPAVNIHADASRTDIDAGLSYCRSSAKRG